MQRSTTTDASKNYNRKLNVAGLFTSCYLLYQKENTFNLIGFHMRKDVMKKRSLFLEVIFFTLYNITKPIFN